MKKMMIGLMVMLVFQFCTSELNEIGGIVGDHIDPGLNGGLGTDRNDIPSNSFLVEYFQGGNNNTSISTRTESRINHDFNSPVSNLQGEELGAKWTGDFYFNSGDYVFSVKSNKGIKVLIDDRIVLNDLENNKETNYNINQQLDGVHTIEVEYNINGNNSEENSVSIDSDTESITGNEGGNNTSNVTNTGINDESVVDVDNTTPTVEVDWKPVDSEGVSFFEGFENGLIMPPWRKLGHGIVETVSSPTASGSKALRMYLERKLYSSSGVSRSHLQYNGGEGYKVPKFQPHFSTWGARFALYVPSDFVPDPTSEIIFQYHGLKDKQDTYTENPSFHLSIVSNKFEVVVRTIAVDPGSNDDRNGSSFRSIANVSPGHWHYFVVDTHWDYRANGNGYHRVYMKTDSPPLASDIIVNYTGGTGYNDFYNAYAIFNIYKFNWSIQSKVNQSIAAGVKYREYFFDNIEISNNSYF